jgi:hypothetical protein
MRTNSSCFVNDLYQSAGGRERPFGRRMLEHEIGEWARALWRRLLPGRAHHVSGAVRDRNGLGGPRYRLVILCRSSECDGVVGKLCADLGSAGMRPSRVVITNEWASARPAKIDAYVDCEPARRAVLARFVEQGSDLKGVHRIHWETVPLA